MVGLGVEMVGLGVGMGGFSDQGVETGLGECKVEGVGS